MLRLRKIFIPILAVVSFTRGGIDTQHKGDPEVSVSLCWQFPADHVVGLATDGRDIFVALQNGHVIALSSEGEKLWDTDLGGEITSVSFDGNDLVVAAPGATGANGVTRHLAVRTGIAISGNKDVDSKPASAPAETVAAPGSEGLVLGNATGLVTSLSGTGPVWKFKTGGAISAIVPAADQFIVISRDNFIYSLHARNGGLGWKRRLTGRVAHYVITEKYLLVSSMDQHGATLIDLVSGRVAGQILLGGDDQIGLDPVVSGDAFTIATSIGLKGYSLSSCGHKGTASKP